MDGWITIGTDIDSQKFDKEIKRLEKDSEKFAKEEEQLLTKKAKLEIDTTKTNNALAKVDKQIELINNKLKLMEQGNLPENLKTNETYQKLNVQVDSLISKSQEYADRLTLQKNQMTGINEKISQNAISQQEVNSKLEETKAKSMGLHMNFDSIGKSLMDNVKKVGKWTMAIFSLRTAYSMIRNVTSTIASYNDGINNKLYSMKMMFATALEPIVTRLVNLFWKIMAYVAYIVKAWFGIDLFAKASANSLKSGAKSAKEIKKSLAGFDEANILNDNGTTGAGGSVNTPKFEMPENVEIPSWVKWIANNKDLILGFLKQLGIIIAGLKLAKLFGIIGNIGKGLSTIFGFLKGMSGLQIFALIAGVALTLTGIVTTGKAIINFIKNPSWKNFNKILEGLTLTLTGVGLAMVALNASNPVGWIIIAVGVLTGLVTLISSFIEKLFKSKANILDTKTAQEQLTKAQEEAKNAQDNLTNATNNYISAVDRAEDAEKALQDAEKKHKISGEELQKQVENGTLSYQTMDKTQREVYKAYLNNISAQENLKKTQEEVTKSTNDLTEAKKKEEAASLENELALGKETGSYDKYKEAVIKAYKEGKISAEEARDYIERAMGDMSNASKQTFQKDLPDDIKNGLNPNKYESTWSKFKKWWDEKILSLNKNISLKINGNFSGSAGNGGGSGGGRGFAKGGIVYPKLQYLASGGIINQPGRGVPLTQAIGGERGQEGIVPLTDSQQMDLLGQAIARHMTINLTNVTQMNGRVLSRELKTMEAQQDFATNR